MFDERIKMKFKEIENEEFEPIIVEIKIESAQELTTICRILEANEKNIIENSSDIYIDNEELADTQLLWEYFIMLAEEKGLIQQDDRFWSRGLDKC